MMVGIFYLSRNRNGLRVGWYHPLDIYWKGYLVIVVLTQC